MAILEYTATLEYKESGKTYQLSDSDLTFTVHHGPVNFAARTLDGKTFFYLEHGGKVLALAATSEETSASYGWPDILNIYDTLNAYTKNNAEAFLRALAGS